MIPRHRTCRVITTVACCSFLLSLWQLCRSIHLQTDSAISSEAPVPDIRFANAEEMNGWFPPAIEHSERLVLSNIANNKSIASSDPRVAVSLTGNPKILANEFDGIQARAFVVYNNSLPCFHPTDNRTDVHWTNRREIQGTPSRTGLLFLKLLKTGSSTAAGVHLRIARNVAARQQHTDYSVCKTRFLHGQASPSRFDYGARQRHASFLWTLVRDPTDRAASEFFHFEVSRKGVPITDAAFINFLRTSKHMNHHYISWLSTRSYNFRSHNATNFANQIFRDYDFVGVTERFDESLIALMIILRLPLAHILYVAAKSNGGYDDGAWRRRCVRIQPSRLTQGMQAFLASDEWQSFVRPEEALYRAANRSLDLTIDHLGRDLIESNLARFRQAQKMVTERCSPQVRLPCSAEGVRRQENETDCLWQDMGCGFDCLDRVATELRLW